MSKPEHRPFYERLFRVTRSGKPFSVRVLANASGLEVLDLTGDPVARFRFLPDGRIARTLLTPEGDPVVTVTFDKIPKRPTPKREAKAPARPRRVFDGRVL